MRPVHPSVIEAGNFSGYVSGDAPGFGTATSFKLQYRYALGMYAPQKVRFAFSAADQDFFTETWSVRFVQISELTVVDSC